MKTIRFEVSGHGIALRRDGSEATDAPAILFLHGLGQDHGVWDGVIARMPAGLRLLRHDLRGHGGSDAPAPPYSMGALIAETEAVLDAEGVRDAVVLGLGAGGLIAQGLAIKRLDLVRALVLTGTAARIGFPAHWQARIAAVNAGGMAAVADVLARRWFPRNRAAAAHWSARLLEMQADGFGGVAAAIAGSDFYTPTSGLRLPLLAIAGADDGATPPDMVRETAGLVPGARFELLRGVGHLAPWEAPDRFAGHLDAFLTGIGHRP